MCASVCTRGVRMYQFMHAWVDVREVNVAAVLGRNSALHWGPKQLSCHYLWCANNLLSGCAENLLSTCDMRCNGCHQRLAVSFSSETHVVLQTLHNTLSNFPNQAFCNSVFPFPPPRATSLDYNKQHLMSILSSQQCWSKWHGHDNRP